MDGSGRDGRTSLLGFGMALKIKAKLSRRPKGHVATINMSHIYNRMLHVYLKNFDKSEKKKT
jgi:hypothetical protein